MARKSAGWKASHAAPASNPCVSANPAWISQPFSTISRLRRIVTPQYPAVTAISARPHPAFAAAAMAGFLELAPLLIGSDPREVNAITQQMDLHLKGHPYIKSAIDMACWDARAKATGLPLAEALGGRFGDSVDLYRSIAQ